MRISRISNWAKTTALAGLLAATPLTAKAQYTYKGEKILARDTLELLNFKNEVTEALLIDCDGNPNNFEKFALSTHMTWNTKRPSLKGKEGFMEVNSTQYVDTLVKVFIRSKDSNSEGVKYYIAGPRIYSHCTKEEQSGNIVEIIYSLDPEKSIRTGEVEQVPHYRMEISEKIYNEIADFLKNIQKKEEHVVKPEKTTNNSSNYHPIKDIIDNMD